MDRKFLSYFSSLVILALPSISNAQKIPLIFDGEINQNFVTSIQPGISTSFEAQSLARQLSGIGQAAFDNQLSLGEDHSNVPYEQFFFPTDASEYLEGLNWIQQNAIYGSNEAALSLAIKSDISQDLNNAYYWYSEAADEIPRALAYQGRAQLFGLGTDINEQAGYEKLVQSLNFDGVGASILADAISSAWNSSPNLDPEELWSISLETGRLSDLANYGQYLQSGGSIVSDTDFVSLANKMILADSIAGPVMAARLTDASNVAPENLLPSLQYSYKSGNFEAGAFLGEQYLKLPSPNLQKQGLTLLFEAADRGIPRAFSVLGARFLAQPQPIAGRGKDWALNMLQTGIELEDGYSALTLARYYIDEPSLQNLDKVLGLTILAAQNGFQGISELIEVQDALCENPSANCTPVLIPYATTRKPKEELNTPSDYIDLRDANGIIRYGIAVVSVPLPKSPIVQPGNWLTYISSGIWSNIIGVLNRDLRNETSTMTVLKTLEEASFFDTISELAEEEKARGGTASDLLLFVHGVNTSFRDALINLAEMKVGGRLPGVPVLFSWASRVGALGLPFELFKDVATARADCPALQSFLSNLTSLPSQPKIAIVAYSQGADMLLSGLTTCANQSIDIERVVSVDKVILAAPNVIRSIFVQVVPQIVAMSNSVTLYASQRDAAGSAIGALGGVPIANQMIPSPTIVEGMDTIDVTIIPSSDFAGHGYLFGSKTVLSDLDAILWGKEFRYRCLIPKTVSTTQEKYWLMDSRCAGI